MRGEESKSWISDMLSSGTSVFPKTGDTTDIVFLEEWNGPAGLSLFVDAAVAVEGRTVGVRYTLRFADYGEARRTNTALLAFALEEKMVKKEFAKEGSMIGRILAKRPDIVEKMRVGSKTFAALSEACELSALSESASGGPSSTGKAKAPRV